MGLSDQETSILRLLEEHVKQVQDASKVLDQKAQQIISVSSIILAFLAALNLNQAKLSTTASVCVISALVIYMVIVVLAFFALFPKAIPTYPLNPTWKEVQRILNAKKELSDYYDWLVGSFCEVIEKIADANERKGFFIKTAIILIGVDVILLVIARVFQ